MKFLFAPLATPRPSLLMLQIVVQGARELSSAVCQHYEFVRVSAVTHHLCRLAVSSD